jgi:hypothetical protein
VAELEERMEEEMDRIKDKDTSRYSRWLRWRDKSGDGQD